MTRCNLRRNGWPIRLRNMYQLGPEGCRAFFHIGRNWFKIARHIARAREA